MARNRDLLSDKEFFRKTADIAEHVRECKIDISYWDDDNKVIDKDLNTKKEKSKNYILNVATPAVKGLEKFTAFNHEIGHIMMQTPMPEMRMLLDKWTEKDSTRLAHAKYDMMWDMMNVLEDQRIESMMAKLWLANSKRFEKARRNLGKKFTRGMIHNNPTDILLMHRFYRSALVNGKEYKHSKELKQSLDDVIGTGRLGVLVVMRRLKHVVDDYFKDFQKKMDKKALETLKQGHGQLTKGEQTHERTAGDGRDTRECSNKPEDSKTAEEDIEEIADSTIEEAEELLNEWKNAGEDEVEEIRDSMSEESTSSEQPVPSYVLRVKRVPSNKIDLDDDTVNGLKKVFRAITEKSRPVIGYDGDEIDMESYIENKIRGYDMGRCFKDLKKHQKASVLISIDGSGSMENGRIEIARQIVASLFASVKHYPNVELKANVWSSNTRGGCRHY